MSQEELADKLGVSRQAISVGKWNSYARSQQTFLDSVDCFMVTAVYWLNDEY